MSTYYVIIIHATLMLNSNITMFSGNVLYIGGNILFDISIFYMGSLNSFVHFIQALLYELDKKDSKTFSFVYFSKSYDNIINNIVL